METLRIFLQNKLIRAALIGLAVGLFFGLIYGYVINPVEWVNTSMAEAREDLQEDYLRMAIDSYRMHGNEMLAVTRWQELGANGNEILQRIKYSPGDLGWQAVYEFEQVVTIRDASLARGDCPTVTGTGTSLCVFLWAGTTVVFVALAVYFYFKTQSQRPKLNPLPLFRRSVSGGSIKTGRGPVDSELDDLLESEKERFLKNPPLVNHIWTFVMGDDQYEESHSINSKSGDFLGECGIEIAKTMDNSSPKKATAFDIWLFDKNEINTRSIILMSHNAYENDILRTQFEMKGKPTLAEIGKEIEVKTDNLLMQMRVLDMICDQPQPGRCEYFQRLSLDVNIWQQ